MAFPFTAGIAGRNATEYPFRIDRIAKIFVKKLQRNVRKVFLCQPFAIPVCFWYNENAVARSGKGERVRETQGTKEVLVWKKCAKKGISAAAGTSLFPDADAFADMASAAVCGRIIPFSALLQPFETMSAAISAVLFHFPGIGDSFGGRGAKNFKNHGTETNRRLWKYGKSSDSCGKACRLR